MRLQALRSLAVAALLALLPGDVARAQTVPSPYRFIERGQSAEVFVGYLQADPGRFGFGPDGGPTAGLRWGADVSSLISLEVSGFFLPTTRDLVNLHRTEATRVIGEADVLLTVLDAVGRFNLTGRRTWNGIQPFFLAGIGISFDIAGDRPLVEGEQLEPAERFEYGVEFRGVFGAGVRVTPWERFALRADAGLNLYQLDTPEGWLDPELEIEGVADDEWVSGGHFTLGFSYLF